METHLNNNPKGKESLMLVNPLLKDYLDNNSFIKANSLKWLPTLNQKDIEEIVYNTILKGSNEKNVFLKIISLISLEVFYHQIENKDMK